MPRLGHSVQFAIVGLTPSLRVLGSGLYVLSYPFRVHAAVASSLCGVDLVAPKPTPVVNDPGVFRTGVTVVYSGQVHPVIPGRPRIRTYWMPLIPGAGLEPASTLPCVVPPRLAASANSATPANCPESSPLGTTRFLSLLSLFTQQTWRIEIPHQSSGISPVDERPYPSVAVVFQGRIAVQFERHDIAKVAESVLWFRKCE